MWANFVMFSLCKNLGLTFQLYNLLRFQNLINEINLNYYFFEASIELQQELSPLSYQCLLSR